MLKLFALCQDKPILTAAFRRLCVETSESLPAPSGKSQPPSGGCVLKRDKFRFKRAAFDQPPSGGCVLKRHENGFETLYGPSRLQAAVC